MSVRTPDPHPGWLNEEDLYEARRRLPMVYVEAIPVRLDSLGYVTEVGLLYTADGDGRVYRTVVSGRVLYRETLRAALLRHIEKDLGPMAMPQLPASPTPLTVAEYFPYPSETGLVDDRQHVVSMAYIVPVNGECSAREDALELSWLTPEQALSAEVQSEFIGGREKLIRQALAHVGHTA
ncbi:NUDIX hydrolase family protein [Nesterenkonia sphaerica]|uniref:DUF4916 domain-containing protein n=1 Tax=Nesterenkonia sphaerica TaxID=1804988 RepID=A0A5R9AB77_9MICC|nr:NUDIX hydrolase family protein [Nesterenkonia sphaerica]TLP75760.1 DUF4916 domain-containing protein [Nesterenkonia sphaerica]